MTSFGWGKSLGIPPLRTKKGRWPELITVIRLTYLEATCHLCKYLWRVACGLGCMGCMHMSPSFWFLKVTDDRNHCLNVYWLLPLGLKLSSGRGLVECFPTWWKMSGGINQRALPVLRCPPCCMTPCGMTTSCRMAPGQKCYSTPWMSSFTFTTK